MATLQEFAALLDEIRETRGADAGRRLHEIEKIVRRHHVLEGLSPQQAADLLEALGPAFVKMGRILSNRPDIIGPEYARVFKDLPLEASPLPFSTIEETLNAALGHPWQETFSQIDSTPLSSTSIAQIHKARLRSAPLDKARPDNAVVPGDKGVSDDVTPDFVNQGIPMGNANPTSKTTGAGFGDSTVNVSNSAAPDSNNPAIPADNADVNNPTLPAVNASSNNPAAPSPTPNPEVVIKIQRPGIAQEMTADLALMRRSVALFDLTNARKRTKMTQEDFIHELERTTRQEIDFTIELRNLEKFHRLLADQPGVSSPVPFPHLSTREVLVMEYIAGPAIDKTAKLQAKGEDLGKLAHLVAESFATQVVDNGFFHAHPHARNIRVRDHEIVWIDLGVVGTFTPVQRGMIMKMMRAATQNDPFAFMEAVLVIARETGEVDRSKLLEGLTSRLMRTRGVGLRNLRLGKLFAEVNELLREQNLSLPPSYTLLAHAITTLEDVLAEVAPQVSLSTTFIEHVHKHEMSRANIEAKARELGISTLESTESAVRLPAQMSHTLRMLNRGEIKITGDQRLPKTFLPVVYSSTGIIGMAMIAAVLFIGSSIVCTATMHQQLFGMPFISVAGYLGGFGLTAYIIWHNIMMRHR